MAADLQTFRLYYPEYETLSDEELSARLGVAEEEGIPIESYGALLDVPGTRPPADPRPPEVIEAEARTAQDEAQRLITEQDARPTPAFTPPPAPEAQALDVARTTQVTEALQPLDAQAGAALQAARTRPPGVGPSMGEAAVAKGVGRALGATGALALKAGEAAAGQPPGAPPTPAGEFAEKIERNLAEMPHEPGGAGLVEGLTQFLLPFGALTKSAGVIAKGRPIVQTALASGATGATAFSGQQARLSDLVQQHPRLKNPVTEFLASDPDDGFAEGRLKNALEFAGLDVAIAAPFVVAMRGIRGASALGKQDGNVAMAEALEKVKPGRVPREPHWLYGDLSLPELQEQLAFSRKEWERMGSAKGSPDPLAPGPLGFQQHRQNLGGRIAELEGEIAARKGSHAGTPIVEGKVKDAMLKAVSKGARALEGSLAKGDRLWRPVMSRVEEIGEGAGKRVAKRLNEFELEQNLLMGKHFRQVEPFLLSYRKMSKADRKLFDRHALNSEMPEAYAVLARNQRKIPGIKSEFDQLRQGLEDMHKLGVDSGLDIPYRQHYLPRNVRDYKGLLDHLGAKSPLQRKITESGAAKGSFEEREVIREWLESQFKGDGRPGFTQGRVIDKLDDDMLKFYGNFEDTMQNYVRNLTYRAAKNRFVGKAPGKTGYQDEIAELLQRKKITDDDARELRELVGLRLEGGEKGLSSGMKIWRDVVYATSIGNPYSTITQASEYLLNAYRHGAFNVGKTTGETFRRTGIRMEDLGLDDIAAEFANPLTLSGAGKEEAAAVAMNKLLRKTLGVTGFKRMDELMKEGNLNAAFAKAKNLVKDTRSKAYQDFAKEQAQYFGPETKKLIDAIKRGDANDQNVKLYLYEQLAKTQPISLSEMPEQYLKMQDGRVFYFLKSFGLKQLETTRRDILRKLASTNKDEVKEGMKQAIRLGVFFGSGVTTTNLTKDFLLDRDPNVWNAGTDAFWTLFGQSRYSTQKFKSENQSRRQQAVQDLFGPAKLTEITEVVLSTAQGDPSMDVIQKNIPAVGKMWTEWFGAAAQKKKKRKVAEIRKSRPGGRPPRGEPGGRPGGRPIYPEGYPQGTGTVLRP